LAELSNQKCWYCETQNDGRFDWEVEHFRPKGRVIECGESHPGYWWLAFDWRNLRLACTFCNQRRVDKEGGTAGGKRDHFPLLPGGVRAMVEADRLTPEMPTLLDPTRAGEPGLLFFGIDGTVTARYREENRPIAYHRACESVRIYHLDHVDLVEARKRLFNKIEEIIEEAEEHWRDVESDNAAAARAFDTACARLLNMIHDNSRYSAAARDMLRRYRDGRHEWIEQIL
jgi:uncharacterized protein (TIGR02646 family)